MRELLIHKGSQPGSGDAKELMTTWLRQVKYLRDLAKQQAPESAQTCWLAKKLPVTTSRDGHVTSRGQFRRPMGSAVGKQD
eukprot:6020796-Amphidinium_carterae.1